MATHEHNDTAETGRAHEAWHLNESTRTASFLTGRRRPEIAELLVLARDLGSLLATFKPPDGYCPPQAVSAPDLSPEMTAMLRAGSLEVFYSRSADPVLIASPSSPVSLFFPRGPEDLPAALRALEEKLQRLERSRARLHEIPVSGETALALKKRCEDLLAGRSNLLRAQRLWRKMKILAPAWIQEVRRLWRRARRTAGEVSMFLKTAGLGEGQLETASESQQKLERELTQAAELLLRRERWSEKARRFIQDLDDHVGGSLDGQGFSRDWEDLSQELSLGWRRLSADQVRLEEASLGLRTGLADAVQLFTLKDDYREAGLSGDVKDRLRLLREELVSLEDRCKAWRRRMSHLYFALPLRMGRPVYLEKFYLSAALILGRTAELTTKNLMSLSWIGNRLVGEPALRARAKAVIDHLAEPLEPVPAEIRRRLNLLNQSLSRRQSLDLLSRELQKEKKKGQNLTEALKRNRGKAADMQKHLAEVSADRENLTVELEESRREAQAVGRLKIRLLKVLQRKSTLYETLKVEKERNGRQLEQARDREKALRRRQLRLAEYFRRDHARLKAYEEELRLRIKEIAADHELLGKSIAERRELSERLAQSREQLTEAAGDRQTLQREIEAVKTRLLEAGEHVSALEDDLEQHRADLAQTSQTRQTLSEIVAASALRLSRLNQACQVLRRSWERRGRLLRAAAEERDRLETGTARKLRALTRLVSIRENLKTELAAAGLKLEEMRAERRELMSRLEESREGVDRARAAQDTLGRDLENLHRVIREDLGPLIQVLGLALWRAEVQRARFQASEVRLAALERQVPQWEENIRSAATRIETLEREKVRNDAAVATLELENRRAAEERIGLITRLSGLEPAVNFLFGVLSITMTELKRLEGEKALLTAEIASLSERDAPVGEETAARQVLEESLSARVTELAEVRDQAFQLVADNLNLKEDLAGLANVNETLRQNLSEAEAALGEEKGRVEAAWAALNYLGSRADDSLGRFKERLEIRTREVDDLKAGLARREKQIKVLAENRDLLTLLYWILLSSVAGDDIVDLPPPLETPSRGNEAAADDESGAPQRDAQTFMHQL